MTTKNTAAQELGRKGGSVKSDKKAKAARENAKKPRCKWVSAFAYGVKGADGDDHVGLVMVRGKKAMNLASDEFFDWMEEMINRDIPDDAAPFTELLNFSGQTMCV